MRHFNRLKIKNYLSETFNTVFEERHGAFFGKSFIIQSQAVTIRKIGANISIDPSLTIHCWDVNSHDELFSEIMESNIGSALMRDKRIDEILNDEL